MERAGIANANTGGDEVAQEQRVPEVEVQEDVQVKKYNIHVSRRTIIPFRISYSYTLHHFHVLHWEAPFASVYI
jgi:hypothetical protein